MTHGRDVPGELLSTPVAALSMDLFDRNTVAYNSKVEFDRALEPVS